MSHTAKPQLNTIEHIYRIKKIEFDLDALNEQFSDLENELAELADEIVLQDLTNANRLKVSYFKNLVKFRFFNRVFYLILHRTTIYRVSDCRILLFSHFVLPLEYG